MSDPTHVITIGRPELLGEESFEIARLWVTNAGPSIAFINAQRLPDAGQFGMLLADAMQHGATAYANALGISKDEALAQISDGFDRWRDSPMESVVEQDINGEPN